MNRRSAAAIAAAVAMLAGGAQAQDAVTISGTLDTYFGSMRAAGSPRTWLVGSGGMTTSWFGFKGTEELGGGWKAGFALTSFLQVDSGSQGRFGGDTFFSRDANVSLTSPSWGSLTVGRALAPNFLPTILFNPFGDSFTFSPLVLHANVPLFNGTGWTATTPSDTGWSNEVLYSSPSFGGLTANVHYQFGEQPNSAGPHNFGLNLLYFRGPFAATAFYERDNINNPGGGASGDRKTDWMVGASYDFEVVKLFGTYGRARSDVLASTAKTWSFGVSAPVGPGKVLAGVADTDNDAGAGATRRTWTVGYDHALSKLTDVYAMAMHDRISGFNSGNSVGVGIRKRF